MNDLIKNMEEVQEQLDTINIILEKKKKAIQDGTCDCKKVQIKHLTERVVQLEKVMIDYNKFINK